MLFRRRSTQPQLIVSTNVMQRLASNMPAPVGPSLPMSAVVARTGDAPAADVITAVRDSGVVIGFLSSGASRIHLTTRVYDVLTSPEGCGLGRSSSLDAFADQFCDTAAGKRQLVQALAVHRPASDPTALLTRLAVTAWVRTVGLAAQTRQVTEAATAAKGGLPEWHQPGEL